MNSASDLFCGALGRYSYVKGKFYVKMLIHMLINMCSYINMLTIRCNKMYSIIYFTGFLSEKCL